MIPFQTFPSTASSVALHLAAYSKINKSDFLHDVFLACITLLFFADNERKSHVDTNFATF